eukprot:13768775-Heterocapsa_arctica.AAC.1
MVEAGKDLATVIRNDLHCDIALGKIGIAVSHKGLADDLYIGLGELAKCEEQEAPTNLGITFRPGASRGRHGAKCKRSTRLKLGHARMKRIRAIRKSLPSRKHRMFRIVLQGLRPAMDFGTRISGLSDAELKGMRKTLHALAPPAVGGASLTAKMVLHGDAAWAGAMAPARAWAEEIWRAA